MAAELKLSHTAAMILHAIHAGDGYGFSVMEMTGLPSGTVYPRDAAAGARRADSIAVGAAVDRRHPAAAAAQVLQAHALRPDHAGGVAEALSAAGAAGGPVGGPTVMTLQVRHAARRRLAGPGRIARGVAGRVERGAVLYSRRLRTARHCVLPRRVSATRCG